MAGIRKFLGRHHWFCALLFGITLFVKTVMPTGFMPVVSDGWILVQLCSGQGVRMIALELPGTAGDHGESSQKNPDEPCSFSGLSLPTVAAADTILLAVAIAFILTAGLHRPPSMVLWSRVYFRPLAIGPPTV